MLVAVQVFFQPPYVVVGRRHLNRSCSQKCGIYVSCSHWDKSCALFNSSIRSRILSSVSSFTKIKIFNPILYQSPFQYLKISHSSFTTHANTHQMSNSDGISVIFIFSIYQPSCVEVVDPHGCTKLLNASAPGLLWRISLPQNPIAFLKL